MTKDNTSSSDDLGQAMQAIDPNDPDIIAKLNEIALGIAEKQGKVPAKTGPNNLNVETDPMDELGCEGCQ